MESKKQIPCIVMSRVVGYISPLYLWNVGKKEEFKDRKTYKGNKLLPPEERATHGEPTV